MRKLILTLILLSAAPAIAGAQPRATAKSLINKGDLLMARNHVDEAIVSYTKAIELKPDFAEAYVKRGMARRAKGELDGSIEDYERAGSIDPKATQNNQYVAESYSNRGFNKLNDFDVEGAIADFTRAAETNPRDPDHFYKRGHARLIKEDLDGAITDFDKALSLITRGDPVLPTLIYANRGMARHLQGKEEEAQKDFDECVRLNRGEKLMLDRHLMDIQMQIMIQRRLRAERRKGIS